MLRILRINSPEWLYIVGGLVSAALVGAQNPCFAILFSEFLDVSFPTFGNAIKFSQIFPSLNTS